MNTTGTNDKSSCFGRHESHARVISSLLTCTFSESVSQRFSSALCRRRSIYRNTGSSTDLWKGQAYTFNSNHPAAQDGKKSTCASQLSDASAFSYPKSQKATLLPTSCKYFQSCGNMEALPDSAYGLRNVGVFLSPCSVRHRARSGHARVFFGHRLRCLVRLRYTRLFGRYDPGWNLSRSTRER